MPNLSIIKRFEPAVLTILFFGIYTTERMKFVFAGGGIRYSLLFLGALLGWDLIREPSVTIKKLTGVATLIAFLPFLGTSLISAAFSEHSGTALLVWLYNAITLIACAHFVTLYNKNRLLSPWIWAMLAHAGVVIWDIAAVANWIPRGWAIGMLYPTYETFRPSGLYVAPQFYSTACFLTAAIMAQLGASRAFLFAATLAATLSFSRTGIAMFALWITLVTVAGVKGSSLARFLRPLMAPGLLGVACGLTLLGLATSESGSSLTEILGLQKSWARVCPLVSSHCPPPEAPPPEGNPKLTSEGRRLAEWGLMWQDLKEHPILGHGYIGASEEMTYKPMLEEIRTKRIQYRFESLWATIGSYYGIAGLFALIFGLCAIGRHLKWHWKLAAPLAFWIVGAQSSQVFARLDIWLPMFILFEYLRSENAKPDIH
jgi:hypothetical protein